MKNTFKSFLLLMISIGFGLQSCQNKTENIEQTETQKAIKSDKNSTSENNEHPENIKNDDINLGEDLSKINAYARKISKKKVLSISI